MSFTNISNNLPINFFQENSIEEKYTQENTAASKRIFKERWSQSKWAELYSENSDFQDDCEGLAHYLLTGRVGIFKECIEVKINKVHLDKISHRPYTCYEIWQPAPPWVCEEQGFWGTVHYFTHLEEGRYISKNGGGAIRIFNSYKDMLEKDAFPFGYVTESYTTTKDVNQAMIGESIVGTIS